MGMQYSRGLVAGYPFENSGADIMGVNNGTVNGAVYVDGQCGRALSFDGVDDYVTMGNNALMSHNSPCAISLRFKIPSGTIPAYGGLLSIRTSTNNFIVIYSTDTYYNLSFGFATAGLTGRKTATLPSRDVWHHLVVSYNGSIFTAYVDCVLQSISATSYPTINIINSVGRYTTTSSAFMKGLVDQLQIFNRALAIHEIKELYLNLGI